MTNAQPKPARTGLERGHGFRGPAVKAKNQKATLYRIWTYLRKQSIGMIFSTIFVVLSSCLNLLGPYLIGHIIDEYIIPKDVAGAVRMLMLLLVVYVSASVFSWLQTFVMVRVSLHTIQRLRKELFEKYQSLPLSFFDKNQQGDLMSRMTNDIENLHMALSQSIIQIVSSLFTIVGTAIAMVYLNWMLAIVSLIIIPLIVFTTKQIIKRSSVNYRVRQKDLGNLNGYIEETISNANIITLFGKENETIENFKKANEKLRMSALKAETVSGFLGPVNNFVNNIGLGIIIGAGAILALHQLVTVGVIASFVTYSRQFFRPINQLSNLLNTFQSAIAGAERVFEILDEKEEPKDAENAIQKDRFLGEVEFRHVNFNYTKDKQVLHDITFTAKPGEMIALVGPTGSGKTTIIQLLNRFYDVTSGEILIDGVNIKNYAMENLRSHIGVVLQDTYLFSGTVRDNIRYGKLDATDEEVEQAAKIAYAHNFIKYLPDGYDTMLTSGGMNLSQGQRQLIAIARAILENPDILILDEATSSVDTMTEVHIQKGLNNLMKGRTSFVIAHRLKTIENADKIFVIQNGKIIEQGNHETLLEKDGFYANLQKQLIAN